MCYFNYENLNTMSKKKFIHKVLLPNKENYYYPLSNDNLSKEDLDAGIKNTRIFCFNSFYAFYYSISITFF
jgi:hypothetical protein